MQPLIEIDFASSKLSHRLKTTIGFRQGLAKAVGLRQNYFPTVLDATAGLGSDAFLLASFGCRVILFERCQPVYRSLKQAINQGLSDSKLALTVDRMQLNFGCSIGYLSSLTKQQFPEIIYLDPMFPTKKKNSLPKKPMRQLREIAGADLDSHLLFTKAVSCALKRVIVKLPKSAKPMGEKKILFSTVGRSCRFDVYQGVGVE